MAAYVRRILDHELDELSSGVGAIALDGPKGVGKTATALQRAATVYQLDDSGQRALLEADPERLASGRRPVLVDEWQRFPESWDIIRRAVDADPSPGQFLLTGSASPLNPPTHSGAARIVSLRMRPMTLSERGLETATVSLGSLLAGHPTEISGSTGVQLGDYTQEIVASGLPGVRHLTGRPLRAQLDGYLERIVDRDFPDLGQTVRNPGALRRWMAAYAAATATTTSYERLRDAATSGQGNKPAKTTTQPYRDVLERIWIADPVPAWLPSRNRIARLAASPKHHLADPALAARLLGVGVDALLQARPGEPRLPRDGTLLGALFESLVTLCVRVYAQAAEATVLHLRTRGGQHEVDLIVERDDGRVLAIEVKLARDVSDADVRQLAWLRGQIGDDLIDAVVVTAGRDAYRRRDGVAVVPAALLGP